MKFYLFLVALIYFSIQRSMAQNGILGELTGMIQDIGSRFFGQPPPRYILQPISFKAHQPPSLAVPVLPQPNIEHAINPSIGNTNAQQEDKTQRPATIFP